MQIGKEIIMHKDYKKRGMYLEDFELGKEYITPSRTITEADVVNFAMLSGDYNDMHMDEEESKKGIFGTRIAHGLLGVAISTGLSIYSGFFDGTSHAFAEINAKYLKPLMIGETIHLKLVPIEIKPSRSKPDRGIIKFDAKVCGHEDDVIIQEYWTIMMKTKPVEE